MKCPECGNLNAEECADVVDIGVGELRHVYGIDCPECGQIPICECGAVNGKNHAAWCIDAPGN